MDNNYYLASDIIEDAFYQLKETLSKSDSTEIVNNNAIKIIVKAAADLDILISKADNTGMENIIAYHNVKKVIDYLENAKKQFELYNSLNERGNIVSLQSQVSFTLDM